MTKEEAQKWIEHRLGCASTSDCFCDDVVCEECKHNHNPELILDVLKFCLQTLSETDSIMETDTGSIEKIARHYGIDSQLGILQEECAELIQAVSKFKRNTCKDDTWKNYIVGGVASEIADVKIMCEQIEYLLCISDKVRRFKESKIIRQLNRMAAEEVIEDGEKE